MGAQWKQKHREAAAAAKGKIFTKLAKEIAVAAKNGADPAMNATLRMAMEAGGNRLVGTSNTVRVESPPPSLAHALGLLEGGHADIVRPHAMSLAAQLMPLLELLQDESGIALPLAALKEKIRDRG